MYSITEPLKPPNPLKSTKTTPTLFILLCLNHKTRYYPNTKRDFSLYSKPLILANSEATRLLLQPLTLNAGPLTNALEEYPLALLLPLITLSLRVPKSRRSSNISSTSIRADLRPSYARW